MAHGESFIADSCSNVNSGYEGVRSTWNWCGVGGCGAICFWTRKKQTKTTKVGWCWVFLYIKFLCENCLPLLLLVDVDVQVDVDVFFWLEDKLVSSVTSFLQCVCCVTSGRNRPTSTWWTLDFWASPASAVERQGHQRHMLLGYLDVHNLQAPMGWWSMRPKDSHLTTSETTVTRLFVRHLSWNSLKHQLSSRFHNKMGHGSHFLLSRFWTYLTFFDLPPKAQGLPRHREVRDTCRTRVGSGKWICFFSGFLKEVRFA